MKCSSRYSTVAMVAWLEHLKDQLRIIQESLSMCLLQINNLRTHNWITHTHMLVSVSVIDDSHMYMYMCMYVLV